MEHWIADGAFLLVGLLFVIVGYKRGIFITIIRFLRFIIAGYLAYIIGAKLGKIISRLFLYDSVRQAVFGKASTVLADLPDGADLASALNFLPQFLLSDGFKEQLNSLTGSGEDLVNKVTDLVSGWLSDFIGRILVTAVAFLFMLLFILILIHCVRKLKKEWKLIGTLDSILGGIVGFCLAWLVLLLAGSVMKMLFVGNEVYESSILVKFFADSTLQESLKFLNVYGWLPK